MRIRHGITLGIALSVLLVTTLAPPAGADWFNKHKELGSDLLPLETFNTSGEFTGELSGSIAVDGVLYTLGPNVQIYEIGVGLIPAGTVIDTRRIFLSGLRTSGSDLVFSVIVRPADVPSLDQEESGTHIQEKDPRDPE